jgi:uncharacterized protein YjbI with pentapeptide repeats
MKRAWKKYLLYGSAMIIGGVLLFGLIRLILLGYTIAWTGFGDYIQPNNDFVRAKTLWDWMELLIVPFVLAGGVYYLNRSERTVERQRVEKRAQEEHKLAVERANLEREIARDSQQEAALQAYLDRMAELLLKENLPTTDNQEVRNVARVRTLTVLRGLDAKRKGMVLLFLKESELIAQNRVVDLTGANLTEADLSIANLGGTNLSGADLGGANLNGTVLIAADLSDAILIRANLSKAYLDQANLSSSVLIAADLSGASLDNVNLMGATLGGVGLSGAKVTDEQLSSVKSLQGATMPDGTKHD